MYPLFLSDFKKLWIFLRYFRKKYSDIKFHENPSSGCRVVPCGGAGQTRDEAKSGFSQFCQKRPQSIRLDYTDQDSCPGLTKTSIFGRFESNRACHY